MTKEDIINCALACLILLAVILIGGALTALYWLPTLLVGWWLF